MRTEQLILFPPNDQEGTAAETICGQEQFVRAIEAPSFPFEQISRIAELESWRKEINRPIYHVHKWWAQRLGSVFRAMVLATFAPESADVIKLFYSPARVDNAIIFDPFMGSGTTVGEVLKVGGRAIGRDINAVACFLVKNALSTRNRMDILSTYAAIQRDVAHQIQHFYRARLANGLEIPVLYYFWVKQVVCPNCSQFVDLFDSYVFAHHAYPKKHPEAKVLCPACGAVETARFDSRQMECSSCHNRFDPASGPARRSKATCRHCGSTFRIADAVQRLGRPPSHRQYAKIVLMPDGQKSYLPTDAFDRELYERAVNELTRSGGPMYVGRIEPGYNTDQILNYCYTEWSQLFNARQLLCLTMLADRIKAIQVEAERELFCCLFSGMLEFNNMFASFKGEGTGAVRHMFSHHILKPEKAPLEANPWGTSKSSGSFSTLFRTRVLRAFDYREKPFEIREVLRDNRVRTEKVFGLSESMSSTVVSNSIEEFEKKGNVYLSCGDSAHTDLANGSVDAVITDPPFFDNVHYSQLADFFYGWQRYILGPKGAYGPDSTRSGREVQQTDAFLFAQRLAEVWQECHRVMKASGLLVFTYHHSRPEGWRSVLAALRNSDFWIAAAYPIKSEMSVATPKHQAREPIDVDIILVCRKVGTSPKTPSTSSGSVVELAREAAQAQVQRLRASGQSLSRNDVQAIFMAQAIALLSRNGGEMFAMFDALESQAASIVSQIHTS